MFDQRIQDVDLNDFLATAADNPQALVLSAYLEEKKKWEDKAKKLVLSKIELFKNVVDICDQITSKKVQILETEITNNNKIGFIFNIYKAFHISNKYEKKLGKLNKKVKQLEVSLKDAEGKYKIVFIEHELLMNNAPKSERYELAMIGNNLFKPR